MNTYWRKLHAVRVWENTVEAFQSHFFNELTVHQINQDMEVQCLFSVSVKFQGPVWNKLSFKIFNMVFYPEKWLVKLEFKTVIHTQI